MSVTDAMQNDSFWDHACVVYRKPDIEAACLQLQDDEAVNVPLLLGCCWVALYYGEMNADQVKQFKALSITWTETCIQPLREIRQNMKRRAESGNDWQQLREQVKQLELSAEKRFIQRMEMIIVESHSAPAIAPPLVAAHNSLLNIRQLGLSRIVHTDMALIATAKILHASVHAVYPEIEYHSLLSVIDAFKEQG